MVPLADMGNHNLQNGAWWQYSTEKREFTIKALKDIKENEEITLIYGSNIPNYNWFY